VDLVLLCIQEKDPLRQSRSCQDFPPMLHGTSAKAGGSALHQLHRYHQNGRAVLVGANGQERARLLARRGKLLYSSFNTFVASARGGDIHLLTI
jgi:hypothetical protein